MFQKVILVGNLGRDPEMRYTPSGTPVTNMSVATNRKYTNSAGTAVEETVWFRVAVWGKAAEACSRFLSKGRQVLVEGRLTADPSGNPRIWNRQDGTPGASFEINAQTVRFLGARPGNGEAAEAPEGETAIVGGEEEIPF
jgi:single-strand DNA-binding protein